MTTTLNTDYLLERLSQRITERNDRLEYCDACDAQLTTADYEGEQCSQCGASLVDDESADEDLFMDGYYDAYEDEGQLDDDYEDDDD
jgi:hypothetical protein